MPSFLSSDEFWIRVAAVGGALALLWRALRVGVREIRTLVNQVTYTQECLKQYGPTLLEIAKAFQGDGGKSLIAAVARIEEISVNVQDITRKTQKASDRSIDVLQAGVLQLQEDIIALTNAFHTSVKANRDAGRRA